MRYLLAIMLVITTVGALALPALAQLSDEQYVDEYFGTTALFTTATQIVDPNLGWWGDKLPPQLAGDYGFAAGVVNTLRNQRGIKPLLEQDTMQIFTGWEEPVEGGYQYSVDFIDMRPSEVQAIIDALGGVGKVLPGADLSFRPVTMRNYYFNSTSLDTPVVVVLGSQQLSFAAATPIAKIRSAVDAALRKQYGKPVEFDLYCNTYIQRDGTSGADISIYAQMGEG